jgi:peptide deformylase
MPLLKIELQIAPNPIFRKKAVKVDKIDPEIKRIVESMFDIMYDQGAAGLGANMVGLLKRIIVVDFQEGKKNYPLAMINPVITFKSEDLQTFEEGSLSYPGIRAYVERPKEISVEYTDCEGDQHSLDASDWLATVIQHEIDYLDGKIFLDYISPIKRKILLKKMQKSLKVANK